MPCGFLLSTALSDLMQPPDRLLVRGAPERVLGHADRAVRSNANVPRPPHQSHPPKGRREHYPFTHPLIRLLRTLGLRLRALSLRLRLVA